MTPVTSFAPLLERFFTHQSTQSNILSLITLQICVNTNIAQARRLILLASQPGMLQSPHHDWLLRHSTFKLSGLESRDPVPMCNPF